MKKIRFIGEMAMLYSYGPLGRNFVKIETLNNDTCNLNADVKLTCTAKAISDLQVLEMAPGVCQG